jgi:hypothetical protein
MILRFVALLVVWLLPSLAAAHGFRPGVLTLTEESPGVFAIAWTEPVDTRHPTTVEVAFPSSCSRAGDRLDCASEGLRGEIAFPGLDSQRAPVTTLVRFLDGRTIETMVDPEAARLDVDAPIGSSPGEWVVLGVEHIFGGLDHLAFLFGLLLVVGTASVGRIAIAISAFTLAHSITLALGATGLVTLSADPVEATIAASVVLVAYEALDDRSTFTRRAPWAVAFGFGLVHGLGFASALTTAGLPSTHVALNLLAFNAGVEAGQLALVVVAVIAARVLPPSIARLRPLACYAIGGVGAWWLLDRTLAIMVRS